MAKHRKHQSFAFDFPTGDRFRNLGHETRSIPNVDRAKDGEQPKRRGLSVSDSCSMCINLAMTRRATDEPRRYAARIATFLITMTPARERAGKWLIAALLVPLAGCSELRARHLAREGNQHFREGDYAAAVSAYSASERLYPLPVVAFNHGLACRQLMLPGAKSAENERSVECALAAFKRLKNLDPNDARAEQLYQQTLFDADRFEALSALYRARLQVAPNDPAAINALIQVYSRWDRWDDALHWTLERARREPQNAEAQYAVGVFIYNRLFARGGGTEQSSFDPRSTQAGRPLPVPAPGDITGPERVALADQGIEHLQKAVAIRPNYADALTYLGLLYRQKSFAFFDRPAEWQAAVDSAESFRQKATALHAVKKP
jgi:tetratricopeptide (TPR) repeat protein